MLGVVAPIAIGLFWHLGITCFAFEPADGDIFTTTLTVSGSGSDARYWVWRFRHSQALELDGH